jgi:Flp pilus assembly protein TadD
MLWPFSHLLFSKGPLVAKFSIEQAVALARQHLEAQRVDEAQTVCLAILESNPEQAAAHRLLAVALRTRGNFAQAAEHLQQAARLTAGDVDLWEEAGGMWEALRRWPEAEEAARRALALDPRRPEAEDLLGNVLQAQGRFEEAESAYRRALELEANADRTWSNLGALLQRQGRFPEAEEAYRRSLAIRPHQAEALVNLGALLRLLG